MLRCTTTARTDAYPPQSRRPSFRLPHHNSHHFPIYHYALLTSSLGNNTFRHLIRAKHSPRVYFVVSNHARPNLLIIPRDESPHDTRRSLLLPIHRNSITRNTRRIIMRAIPKLSNCIFHIHLIHQFTLIFHHHLFTYLPISSLFFYCTWIFLWTFSRILGPIS